jgi:maleylacetoacetate isomerase
MEAAEAQEAGDRMRDPIVRLYDYWRSSASYRVRIALNLKGVAYQVVPVNLLTAEHRGEVYRGIDPQGLVPSIEVDGQVITQSVAIIDYLDRRFPEPPLLPADPLARAQAMAKALVVAADVHPVNNLRLMRWLEQELHVDKPERDRWTAHWMAEGFTALEAMAGDGPFLHGETPGLPDLCLVPQFYNARRFDVPLEAYPKLVAIDARCTAIEAFAAAHPDRIGPPTGA